MLREGDGADHDAPVPNRVGVTVKILKEFREFINKGNVLDLAVAVVIGAQFNAVVTSFTNNVLMQVIGAIFGGKPSFEDYVVTINGSKIAYGTFLTALINFVIIAFVLFLVVKAANKAREMAQRVFTQADRERLREELEEAARRAIRGPWEPTPPSYGCAECPAFRVLCAGSDR